MDDSHAFEQQVEREVRREAGPDPGFDALAIARSVTGQHHRWRIRPMFDATRVMIGMAAVAAAGALLASGVVFAPDDDVSTLDAAAAGADCPEATALQDAGTAAVAVPVRGTVTFDEGAVNEESATIDDSGGYARIRYDVDVVVTEFDDPRLNGVLSGVVDAHFLEDDAWVVDGEVTIENDGGAWVGTDRGTGTSDTDQRFRFDLHGTGGYHGCSAIFDLYGDFEASGVIYPTTVLSAE